MKMKIVYLFMIIFFTGCGSSDFVNKGSISILKNRVYVFSDNNIRNLKITFLNDSLIEISNQVTGLQVVNYYRYDFATKYPIKRLDFMRYVIGNPIEKTDSLGGVKYVRPFRKENFYNRSDVFPNVINDTLFFNQDFKKLQLKDFSFSLKDK